MTVIKEYIKRRYDADSSVRLEHNNVILAVPGSALAATIHMERQLLIKACNIGDKRLVIRNSQ